MKGNIAAACLTSLLLSGGSANDEIRGLSEQIADGEFAYVVSRFRIGT